MGSCEQLHAVAHSCFVRCAIDDHASDDVAVLGSRFGIEAAVKPSLSMIGCTRNTTSLAKALEATHKSDASRSVIRSMEGAY
jgi:hypothetical protein